jgi:predicted amidophosphoribosyltransferase
VCDLPIAAPGAALLESPLCGRCQADPPAFDALRAAVRYEGPPAEVLKAFKYSGADYLAPHLARRIAPRAAFEPAPLAVVPVPATRRERRRRGYFPAGELARALARELGLPCVALLTKVRETARQASLPLPARRANVRGAFSAAAAPETVLLVDDVATSGCTLDASARALKRAGARRVFAAAFARALPEAG